MRVLHLIDSGGVYGAEMMLLGLVESQLREGVDAVIGSIAAAGEQERPLEKVCAQRGIPLKKIRFSPALNVLAAGRILREIEAEDMSVLHCHGYKADIIFGMMLCLVRRIPLLTTIHGWTETRCLSRMGLYQALDALSWVFIDKIVAVSDDSPVYRIPYLRTRAVTIENGIAPPVDNVQPSQVPIVERISNHCRGRPCIGMVSRLSREKGMQTMLSALQLLRSQGADYALVIAGEGPERNDIERTITRTGLEDSVLLTGYVDGASQLMPQFDVLAMPSHTEGLPITLLEAMAHGVPVVASSVGQIPKVLDGGACGILIKPGDIAGLASGIKHIINDDQYRNNLVADARRRASKEYSLSQAVKRYSSLYQDLVSRVSEN